MLPDSNSLEYVRMTTFKISYGYVFTMSYAKGKHPRLISSRERIMKLTGRHIPLTKKNKDGEEYIVTPIPICSKCLIPVIKLYRIHAYYRKVNVPRREHRAWECPEEHGGCGHIWKRKIVEKKVEVFDGDRRKRK